MICFAYYEENVSTITDLFSIPTGSAQITCYTVPSVAGELNCLSTTDNFQAITITECCLERNGYFFDGGGQGACQACIGMERMAELVKLNCIYEATAKKINYNKVLSNSMHV